MITITATVKNMDTIHKNITDFSRWNITYRVQKVIFAQGVSSKYVPDRMIPHEIFFLNIRNHVREV
jgi:hypothetical protein